MKKVVFAAVAASITLMSVSAAFADARTNNIPNNLKPFESEVMSSYFAVDALRKVCSGKSIKDSPASIIGVLPSICLKEVEKLGKRDWFRNVVGYHEGEKLRKRGKAGRKWGWFAPKGAYDQVKAVNHMKELQKAIAEEYIVEINDDYTIDFNPKRTVKDPVEELDLWAILQQLEDELNDTVEDGKKALKKAKR